MKEFDTGFVPSVHGFGFPNAWENGAFDVRVGGRSYTVGLRGRCGGMVFAALDLFRRGEAAGRMWGKAMPENSSAIAKYLLRRQIESVGAGFGSNIAKFALLTYLPSGTAIGSARFTRSREVGRVLVAMTAGNPVPLGLVVAQRFSGIGLNHQVVACGAVRDEDGLRIRIYDPNFPGRDDVELRLGWSGTDPIVQYVGGVERKRWRALFVESYSPRKGPGC